MVILHSSLHTLSFSIETLLTHAGGGRKESKVIHLTSTLLPSTLSERPGVQVPTHTDFSTLLRPRDYKHLDDLVGPWSMDPKMKKSGVIKFKETVTESQCQN